VSLFRVRHDLRHNALRYFMSGDQDRRVVTVR
jgi:hypothetical protein